MAASFRIHYLVPAAAGPVESGGGLAGQLGSPGVRVSQAPAKFVCACDPNLKLDGHRERGSGEAWACHCNACKRTDAWKESPSRDHPNALERDEGGAETEHDPAPGCC